jgi:pSer/pThr/pTyr-binding forkhead associated (FHA) protein
MSDQKDAALTGRETIVAQARPTVAAAVRPPGATEASPSVRPGGARKQAALLVLKPGGSISTNIISPDACIARVGSSREESDIVLADPGISKRQLVIMNVGMQWLFMDCGLKDAVEFAGVKKRQAYVPLDWNGVIRVGSTYLVFLGVKGGYDSSKTVRLKNTLTGGVTEDPGFAEIAVNSGSMSKPIVSTGRPLLIGSHDSCDVTIRQRSVQKFHAFIFWHPDGVFLETLGGALSVDLDGEQVSGRTQLPEHCRIREAGQEISVNIDGEVKNQCSSLFPSNAMRFENFALTALSDSEASSFYLPGFGRSVTMGRSTTCDIVLNDSGVSREHAQVVPNGKTLNLVDNYSANGTYVNGERVTKTRIRAGDIIEVGNSFFLVHYT